MLNNYFRPYQVSLRYDELPITELVDESNYLTDAYDQNQDTLKDIKNGAKPGANKKKTSDITYTPSTESDNVYVFGGEDYSDDYGYDGGGYDTGYDGGGETGGETGGDTGGETGGDTGGDTSYEGGETGGDTGYDAGAETGGETGGDAGGAEEPVYDGTEE